MPLYPHLRRLLFRLDPERAHDLGRTTLRTAAALPTLERRLAERYRVDDPRLEQRLLGLRFPNPVGLAAGFDKDGEMVAALPALGFGFAEAGTVTPQPQPGNPRPRLFRFSDEESLQNRMGFNNAGSEALAARLAALSPAVRHRLPVGVNLGKNKDTPAERAVEDYRRLAERLGALADYLVINVSSPNTPGLRALQTEEFLVAVLTAVRAESDRPVLVKLAPDLATARLVELAEAAVASGAAGIVATNTTADLSLLPAVPGGGGLSGRVLRARSFEVLQALAGALAARCVLVSAGGIDSAEEAWRRLRAGAHLVQVYTGFVYRGPGLAREINTGLLARLEAEGFARLGQAVGAAPGERRDADRPGGPRTGPVTPARG
ncbi:MAG TPA: quinone-dependent dihydroorotate dehydrogenase [Thermoanaerobaculia bacterium]|nr:quinone-dependent dihydroorotate dehydrogenase [Thermoanaerobaculia bacterium]